jgi:uncharacterized membrane protein
MKRRRIVKLCNVIGLLLLVGFAVKTIMDGIRYYGQFPPMTSAPFYVFILLNAFYFVFPAIVMFLIGFVMYRAGRKK